MINNNNRHALLPATESFYDFFKKKVLKSIILGCIKYDIFTEEDLSQIDKYIKKLEGMIEWFMIPFFHNACQSNQWKNGQIKTIKINNWMDTEILRISFRIEKKMSIGIGIIASFAFEKAELESKDL